ncbi:CBS domain-containing protein [Nonomuraea soli]|uniref:CBS domain-containing protein n=1 Tax=Nonomuraea soli TaxID=1032476 RepID=A0A7W0CF53_9ACTN|nr:CBS domain-containing protein [Nonomuraea soli]MBA2889999.1 CBS domain-containing protein [Nonomuraea soli]
MRTKVKDVMTAEVVSVHGSTPFKDIAEMIIAHGVSSVPVVDGDGRVVGIVSEADLLYKEEFRELYYREGYQPPLRVRRRHRDAPHRALGDRASQIMTAPAITIRPELSTVAAARLMDERGVKRLVVTDAEDHLVGVVSRRDLLKVFLRPDAELVAEIRDEVLGRGLFVDISRVRVSAHHGEIFLGGRMRHRSETESAAAMSARVNGVVDVINELTWDEDDTPKWGGQ